jgi:parallel beta-helix repeat protein
MRNKRYVTIAGFTFRHVQDGGIVFFKGASDGIAIGNTAYGSRQGIRVYGATNISLYGNTLFRNENSGAYFAAGSFNGVAIGNVAYENVKGLRFGSDSQSAVVADKYSSTTPSAASPREVERAVLRGNTLVNNAVSQLLVLGRATARRATASRTALPISWWRTSTRFRRAIGSRRWLSTGRAAPGLPFREGVPRAPAEARCRQAPSGHDEVHGAGRRILSGARRAPPR